MLDKVTYRNGNLPLQAGAKKVSYSPRLSPPGRKPPAIGVPAAISPSQRPGVAAFKPSGPGKSFAVTIDHAIATAGMAVAIGAIAFAASMIAQNDRGTRLEPSDDFRLARLARTRTHLAQEPFGPLNISSIDYNATGSIFRPGSGHGVPRPGARLDPAKAPSAADQSDNYVLSFVYKNMALVKSIHAAKPGTLLPGAGRVHSIEPRGHKWVLVTERTVITESN